MRRATLVLLLAASSASAADPTRFDLYGDPLPAGAVARLGSVERSGENMRNFHFAADGKTFHASARGPAWVQFDAATGKRLRVTPFAGLDGSWPWVSADGSTAVVEQPGGHYHILDVPTGKVFVTIPATAAFRNFPEPLSPNGRYFAAADRIAGAGVAQTLSVWDTHTGASSPLGAQTDPIRQVWFSPDGVRLLVMGNADAVCWDVRRKKELWRVGVPVHDFPPLFRPDGKAVILQGRRDRLPVTVLDIDSGEPAAGVKQPVYATINRGIAASFLDDGRSILMLASNQPSDASRWRSWDTRDGGWREFKCDTPWTRVFSPDGKLGLLIPRNRDRFQMNDVTTGAPLYPDPLLQGHISNVAHVAFDPTGERVYTVDQDSQVFAWDATTGKRVGVVNHRQSARHGSSLSVRRDGKQFLLHARGSDQTGTYFLMTPDSDRVQRAIPYPERPANATVTFHGSHLSADGAVIRTSRYERRYDAKPVSGFMVFQSWSVPQGKLLGTKEARLRTIAWNRPGTLSPDGRLATDGEVVYEFGTAQVVARLTRPGEQAYDIPEFSADGRFLAIRTQTVVMGQPPPEPLRGIRSQPMGDIEIPVPGQLPHVWVWDVLTSKVVGRVTVGADHMRITPDGRFLVTLDATGVSAWDIASGRQLVHHKADPRQGYFEGRDHTTALTVSSDGRLAVTGRADGTALVWDMSGAYAAAVNVQPLPAEQIAVAWAAFGESKESNQFGLMWRLIDGSAASVPFLRDRVKAAVVPFVPPTEEAIRSAVAELDDDDFATREKAEKELRELGEAARAAMREAHRKPMSPEQRDRLSRLLTKLDSAPVPELRKEDRPLSWALAILERVGTPEARDAIRHMASGPPNSRLTREALAALDRLPK